MASTDDTGNDARARRIEEIAIERGWSMKQSIRYSIAAGYLVGSLASRKERRKEAAVVRDMNTIRRSAMEADSVRVDAGQEGLIGWLRRFFL